MFPSAPDNPRVVAMKLSRSNQVSLNRSSQVPDKLGERKLNVSVPSRTYHHCFTPERKTIRALSLDLNSTTLFSVVESRDSVSRASHIPDRVFSASRSWGEGVSHQISIPAAALRKNNAESLKLHLGRFIQSRHFSRRTLPITERRR